MQHRTGEEFGAFLQRKSRELEQPKDKKKPTEEKFCLLESVGAFGVLSLAENALDPGSYLGLSRSLVPIG
jgi:hypothetical protein